MSNKEILELKFFSNDLDVELTIKEYLKKLLYKVWEEAECFSGKRPFGNSGWQYEMAKCLIVKKVISGELDEDDEYVEDVNFKDVDKVMLECIKSL